MFACTLTIYLDVVIDLNCVRWMEQIFGLVSILLVLTCTVIILFYFLLIPIFNKLHIGLVSTETKKTREDKTGISGTFEKNQSKNKKDNEISHCGTIINNSDKKCTTACTITAISYNKNNSNPSDDNIVKTNTIKSTDIKKKDDFTVQVFKNLTDQNIQLQDEKSSDSYDVEAAEFLDNINFENIYFDDYEKYYIVESIQRFYNIGKLRYSSFRIYLKNLGSVQSFLIFFNNEKITIIFKKSQFFLNFLDIQKLCQTLFYRLIHDNHTFKNLHNTLTSYQS